ncbi:MAG TPA: hypothetical protein VHS29_10000 [Candidatus Acidoferrales bacterium]|jgi:hypothetical protein|nr:hypothetical protein [Candidatus Acidoferrales bacterium]
MHPCIEYELRFAVTGHRKISDEAAVARAIEGVIDRINRLIENAGAAPPCWTIVSPLARGADQIAAKALIERAHARLEVLTPFPLEDYRKDFSSGGELASFENLLARASVVEELPCRVQDAAIRGGGEGTELEEMRDAAYLRAGERVVEVSEILLAVWDGREAAGVGGTAEIVEYAIERDRVVLWIDAEHPEEPPRRIHAVNFRDHSPDKAAIVRTEEFPRTLGGLSRGYGQQLAYFQDQRLIPADYENEERRTREHLSEAAVKSGLPQEALHGILSILVPQFARADSLALLYHRKHARGVSGILYLAALAVTIAVGQVLFFPEQHWLIVFEVLAMLAILVLWMSAGSSGWHEKWLHARYIAEQLRIATFTTLLEPESHKEKSDPLPFYRGPQQWLTQTVKAIVTAAGQTVPALPLGSLKQFLVSAWLEDQQKFHARSAKRKERSAHRRHQIGFALFGTTLLMAVLHFSGVGHFPEVERTPYMNIGVWITFLALVLPAWAGAVHAVTSQLELERIAERSHRMSVALEWLAHRATRATTLGELAETVNETAELMMVENHEWWVLLSFQGARLHV